MKVGVLLFDDVTITDFTGPYDVFRAARPLGVPTSEPRALFSIFTVGERDAVRANGELCVLVGQRLNDHPPAKLLVVPGSFGARRDVNNAQIVGWLEYDYWEGHRPAVAAR